MLVLGLGLLGCHESGPDRDVVARIDAPGGPLVLDRRVVEQLAHEQDLDEAAAREQALDQLRWVAARRARLSERETPPEHPDDLDPNRREQLERAALIRLWLREDFEPAHTASQIPAKVVEQNLQNPSMTRRLFHPELWLICQVLIQPSEKDANGRNVLTPTEPEAAARWQADATRAFAPFVARIEAARDDVVGDTKCSVLGSILENSEREFETPSGAMVLKFESFAFAPELADTFDRKWLSTVTAVPSPGLVGPFSTPFGQHLVVVNEVKPPSLPDGSMPAEQLAAARADKLRAELEVMWRTDQLQRILAEARDRRVVRLGGDLAGPSSSVGVPTK